MTHVKTLSICCFVAIVSFSASAQDSTIIAKHRAIDKEINKRLECCYHPCYADEKEDDGEYQDEYATFKQDVAYSVVALQPYRYDTLLCAKKMGQYLTIRMLNYVDTGNYDIVLQHCLQYARDTSFYENDYNSIVDIVRRSLKDFTIRENMPTSIRQFIGSSEFYKATTDNLALLLSYMDMYEEVENLKRWKKAHYFNKEEQRFVTISLVRLGDSLTTKEYIAMTPTNSDDWHNYILGLNYARTRVATERLIDLLDNKTKIEYYEYMDSDSPAYYTYVGSYVLEVLVKIVEDFPIQVDVPYDNDLFSVVPKKVIKQAKQWFKDNPDYKIIRKSNHNW